MHQQLGTLVLSAFAPTTMCVLCVFLHFVIVFDELVGLPFRVSPLTLGRVNYKYVYVRYLK